jgi:hypothetical protein
MDSILSAINRVLRLNTKLSAVTLTDYDLID